MPVSIPKTVISLLLVVSAMAVTAYGQDAQQVTQSVLDQHKSADPTNSDRSLTEKKPTETIISDVPFAKPVSRQTQEQAQKLRERQAAFIRNRVESEQTSKAKSFTSFDVDVAKKEATKAWEKTDDAERLRQLERKIAKTRKRESDTQISDVPFARPKR